MKNNFDELFKRISKLPIEKQNVIYFEISNMLNDTEKELIGEHRKFECELRGHVFSPWKNLYLYQINDPELAEFAEEKYGDLYGGSVGYERRCSSCGLIEQTLSTPKELKRK